MSRMKLCRGAEVVEIPRCADGEMHEQHRGGRLQLVQSGRIPPITAASIATYIALREHEAPTEIGTAIEAAS